MLGILFTVPSVFGQPEDEGEKLFEKRCGSCHVLPDPENLTAEMWSGKMVTMAPMAQLFDEQQKAAVLGYLHTNAGTKDQILVQERRYFDRLCSSCHDVNSVLSSDKAGLNLENFLIDHMIEEADQDIEESDAHEVAEFMLHISVWKK